MIQRRRVWRVRKRSNSSESQSAAAADGVSFGTFFGSDVVFVPL